MKARLDPRIVAASTQEPAAGAHGASAARARITPSSHGGRALPTCIPPSFGRGDRGPGKGAVLPELVTAAGEHIRGGWAARPGEQRRDRPQQVVEIGGLRERAPPRPGKGGSPRA